MPRRVPSLRRFAAGALASIVAIFGVLALRVHSGVDPALAGSSATAPSSPSAGSATPSAGAGTPPSDDGSSSSSIDPSAGWSSGPPTTRAS
jgi:hypothetical protein